MKSIIAFVGSARKKGGTYAAALRFLGNLQASGGVQGEVVLLSDCRIGLCRGCKACFVLGEERCPLKDDRDVLIEKIIASDGVVLASPNYSFQVSTHMKAFLERLGFLFHRPRFHGKAMTAIVTQGFYGGDKLVKYLEFVGLGLGFNVVKGSCLPGLEPLTEADRRKIDEVLAAQSGRFLKQLSKPAYPAPSLMQLLMFRGARTASRLVADDGNRDHTYYRDKGWFDSDYFYPTKLGPVKKTVGAAIDWMSTRQAKQRAKQENHP